MRLLKALKVVLFLSILCISNYSIHLAEGISTQIEQDAPFDEYKFKIKCLTPYGDEFDSLNELIIRKGFYYKINRFCNITLN